MESIRVGTDSRTAFVDITHDVQEAVEHLGTRGGIVSVFVPHTTAGVTIYEKKLYA